MQVIGKGSFYRDWQQVHNRALSISLRNKISEIESANNISQISHLKNLRKFVSTSKIEIKAGRKTYWILCKILGDTVVFVRLKSERYFKKNL